jgi:uncharacterized membrane protein
MSSPDVSDCLPPPAKNIAPFKPSSPPVTPATIDKREQRRVLARYAVVVAAGSAFLIKILIAWSTFGTNDVAFFYAFGKSLTLHGLQWTYASDIAFNHPPAVATFLRWIYGLDHVPWMHEHGIAFPFLLRLPGIISDFVVVLLLLAAAPSLRLPMWSLLVLALNPVSVMISGFHGNTDSIMVMLTVFAACACLWERPILSGILLALSTQVKIIPLLLVPIFFFYWLHRRRVMSFTVPFTLSLVLLWIEPILRFPGVFIHRVLFYGSFWGLWGATYWLRLTGVRGFAPVTYYHFLPLQQLTVTVLKLLVIAAVLIIGWRRRQLDARGLFVSVGWAWVAFFILSPGVCAQYLVWPMPFVLALSPLFFASLVGTSSLFLFFFYNTICGGLPWYLGVSTGKLNDLWLPWSIWPWTALIAGAFLLWQRALRENGALRLLSLDPVKPIDFP